jgi:hypothetical protein
VRARERVPRCTHAGNRGVSHNHQR